jgi:hypothetical protein
MAFDPAPLIEGIARFVGIHGEDATEGAASKVARGAPMHTPTDVERWIGPNLSAPEKQLPLIHDYLRGASALASAKAGNLTHVDDVSVPAWQSLQNTLETRVRMDPEVQKSLQDLYVNSKTPPDPTVKSTVMKVKPAADEPTPLGGGLNVRPPQKKWSMTSAQAVEVPADTPVMPQAKLSRMGDKLNSDLNDIQREGAWTEFSLGLQTQDPVRIEGGLEQIKALHAPDMPSRPGAVPDWQQALTYMGNLEKQVGQWKTDKVTNDAWSRELVKFHDQSGIDGLALPPYIERSIKHQEAWADAQKPPTLRDRFTEIMGVPRAVMSSFDVSAPGRQGILMMSRPEYWENMRSMFSAFDDAKYHESQRYLQNHPEYETAMKAGLAITDIHDKLGAREEAFQSKLAEQIPYGVGTGIRKSEQAYTTFLNRVRFDSFVNIMKQAAAAGVDMKDQKFLESLAEWVNTATGRGGGKDFKPGPLSTILFSPRLAWARLQTLNPAYYADMHPFVRQQALKTQFASAAAIVSLISLAGMAGAKVTWDFRNPDAGKVRIGNARIDLGGGMFQFIRLFTQIATNETVNPDTGKVTKLGSKYGVPTRLDKVTQFALSKEAPVISFVTDWLRGKDQGGQPFTLSNAVKTRIMPLAVQDIIDVTKDKGMESLLWSVPTAMFGLGMQDYAPTTHETVPFIGVKGEVPNEHAREYQKAMMAADQDASAEALQRAQEQQLSPIQTQVLMRGLVRANRLKVRTAWIKANAQAFREARMKGEKSVKLVAPPPDSAQ